MQGLVQVFEEEYPGYEHKFCLGHLYVNFEKKFGDGTLFIYLITVAAKAAYHEAREAKMMQIREGSFR